MRSHPRADCKNLVASSDPSIKMRTQAPTPPAMIANDHHMMLNNPPRLPLIATHCHSPAAPRAPPPPTASSTMLAFSPPLSLLLCSRLAPLESHRESAPPRTPHSQPRLAHSPRGHQARTCARSCPPPPLRPPPILFFPRLPALSLPLPLSSPLLLLLSLSLSPLSSPLELISTEVSLPLMRHPSICSSPARPFPLLRFRHLLSRGSPQATTSSQLPYNGECSRAQT